jgi:Flp pilus assembly protein TadG
MNMKLIRNSRNSIRSGVGKPIREDEGTSLLEMALLLPIMLLMVIGIIEVGRYAALSITVANAARSAVQYGAQNLAASGDGNGIKNAALNDASLNDAQGNPILSVSPASGSPSSYLVCGCFSKDFSASDLSMTCPASGCISPVVYVSVKVTGTFTSLFKYPGIPSPITLSSTAQMQVAQ